MSPKPRVLVVEDDGEIAEVLRRSLRLEGYEVRLAGDGSDALQESSLFEPDAVVLDLGLPGVDGIEVCRRLRDEGDVPILILTARDGVDARVEGLDDVWGYAPFAETNRVDVFVSTLRRKLEAGGEPRMLHPVRGAGYVLRAA